MNSRTINSLEASHLQYDDNTLVSCVVDKDQLKMLWAVFILVEAT